MKEKEKKSFLKDAVLLLVTVIAAIVLLKIFPERQEAVIAASRRFFIEMMSILPAVMILMGLFAVFVPKETVVKLLGKSAGIKGMLLALFLGALPTGPLYVAFPIASALLKKGARISTIVVFLSAWACIKIPQEMVELQFLGFKFMIARLILTIISVILMGAIIEKMIEKRASKGV